jgi:hypothetical protein
VVVLGGQRVADAGSVRSALNRQATAVAGTSRSALHPRAGTARGDVRSADPAVHGAEAVVLPGRAAESPCRANQAARGVAAAASPARFCLISGTYRVEGSSDPPPSRLTLRESGTPSRHSSASGSNTAM